MLCFALAAALAAPQVCQPGMPCWQGGSPTVIAAPALQAAPVKIKAKYVWTAHKSDRNTLLWHNADAGHTAGALHVPSCTYTPLLAGCTYGKPTTPPEPPPEWAKPPEAPPAKPVKADPPTPPAPVAEAPAERKAPPNGDANVCVERNFGLALKELRDAEERPAYMVGLTAVPKAAAKAALAGEPKIGPEGRPVVEGEFSLPTIHVTAIGTKEEIAAVRKDWESHPDLKALHGKCAFHSYMPDDPMVRELGYAPGKPAIYLQTNAKGQPNVLARGESYPGAATLAGEIRKRVESYDPSKDALIGASPAGAAGLWRTLLGLVQKLGGVLSIPISEGQAPFVLAAIAAAAFHLHRSRQKEAV